MKLLEISHFINPDEAAKIIITHCKPFLEQINYKANDYMMYRGVKSKDRIRMQVNPNIGLRTIQGHNPTRHPVDTVIEVHDALNKIFISQYGVPFRNGVFTTGHYATASGYGNMSVIVIPVGDFKYIWSKKFADLWPASERILHRFKLDYPNENVLNRADEIATTLINEAEYKTTDLTTAIKMNREIMLYCDLCIVLRTKQDDPLAVLQHIQNSVHP